MLIRGDLSNRLWRTDSRDGGYTWSDPVMTDIPNPGSKPLILNLPDGRIVLFHNPREKDYDDLKSVITSYSIHYTKLYDEAHADAHLVVAEVARTHRVVQHDDRAVI